LAFFTTVKPAVEGRWSGPTGMHCRRPHRRRNAVTRQGMPVAICGGNSKGSSKQETEDRSFRRPPLPHRGGCFQLGCGGRGKQSKAAEWPVVPYGRPSNLDPPERGPRGDPFSLQNRTPATEGPDRGGNLQQWGVSPRGPASGEVSAPRGIILGTLPSFPLAG